MVTFRNPAALLTGEGPVKTRAAERPRRFPEEENIFGIQTLNSLPSTLVQILPYPSFSLNSSWFILYSHFHWRKSCEKSHLGPGPCICFRETLGETRCGDVSLRPIPSWKTIQWWMYLVTSRPCPLSGKVTDKLLFSRARPVSGKVMGGTGVLKSMSSFREGDGCTWFPHDHFLFQAKWSVNCYSQENILFQERWWVELVSSMAWCSFVATG